MTSPNAADVPTDLFLSLTPHKVLAAVEASGVLCNPLSYPLNSFENRVYEVECEDRTRLVAKFYRPGRWSRAQVLEEHRFLADLEAAEVPVCPAVLFPGGDTLATIDHIAYCLFRRTGGRAPDELDVPLAARLGRLVARIHNVGAERAAEHRLRLSGDTMVRDDLAWLTARKILPPRLERRYLDAAEEIAGAADERLSGVEVHRIHGDLHFGNLLVRGDVLHVIDFDDMMVGPAVQDVWLLFPGRDPETRALREVFLSAYEEMRRFDRATLRLSEPLRGMRMIHYAAWIARRWHDPIFPRTFVHFGTEAYWDEQTRDLEDLCAVIRAEDGTPENGAAPDAEDGAGSDKDYFWDLE